MTPNLGQGACQAIEDAFLLAESLKNGPTIVAALRNYEARRIKRANTLVIRSRQQGWIGHWKHPLGVRVRDMALRMTPSLLIVKQLEWVLDNQID